MECIRKKGRFTSMKIEEAYKCPKCGETRVNISNIQQIFDDARYEDAECINCGSRWRVYYKMNELKVEVHYVNFEDKNTISDISGIDSSTMDLVGEFVGDRPVVETSNAEVEENISKEKEASPVILEN